MNTQIATLADGDTLKPSDYETLACCGTPVVVGHATQSLPIAGVTCPACLCTLTSMNYGPISVNNCRAHRA